MENIIITGTDILGFVAGTLTTIAFIPQVIKTWRTGSTTDISLIWLLSFSIGLIIWLAYGFLLHSLPIIIANSITIALLTIIVIIKVKNIIKKEEA